MRSISLKELFRQMRLNEAARSPEERKKEYIFVLLLFVFSRRRSLRCAILSR